MGTGEENFSGDSYYGAGILKSTNGGTTWTQFCGPVGNDGYYGSGPRIGGLAIHPTNSQILLAAVALLSQDGVYRSANGGNSWTRVLSGTLFGLNSSAQQIWSTNVGAAIPAPDEQNGTVTTGLGAGDHLLIVPTESVLAAYGN